MVIASAFAIFKYRLYDVDLLINRTLVYGTLTACVVGLYVLTVGALGTFFQAQGNLLIALLATGLVAVLFQPLRDRLQRAVNRLIYGERDDPVEALSRLGRQLETAVPPNNVLPMLVETIAQTLKLPYVAIQLPVEKEDNVAAEYGDPSPEVTHFPLLYQGESIGRLGVASPSPGRSFSTTEERLLRNIARQAGAAVRAVQLTIDLQQSRQRLVTTREEERRRLRRDLHDGLGATLAALHLEVGVLKRSIRSDPEKAERLADELRQDIRSSIENIRLLVYELRPPTLDQLGLVEAVRSQARQCSQIDAHGDSSLQVTVKAPAMLPPLPAAVEVAAYRIVQEALTNVVHHAQAQHCIIRLELADELKVEVVDDGVGEVNGRQPGTGLGLLSMRERAEELGGACLIEPATGGGTRVVASLPLLEE
jgi:two-component system NarL family sensor kinase